MVEKVERFKTEDGYLFDTAKEAEEHESFTKLEEEFKDLFIVYSDTLIAEPREIFEWVKKKVKGGHFQ